MRYISAVYAREDAHRRCSAILRNWQAQWRRPKDDEDGVAGKLRLSLAPDLPSTRQTSVLMKGCRTTPYRRPDLRHHNIEAVESIRQCDELKCFVAEDTEGPCKKLGK
jgi:hypothetical protein